jgi:hypothetical protein
MRPLALPSCSTFTLAAPIALLAVSGPAAAQSVNGVSMLRIANGPGGEIVENENTTGHVMSWNIADGDAQAYTTFNDRNTSLAFCSAGSTSGVAWDVSSRLYGGDVVTFKVPGAALTQVTTLNIKVAAIGSGALTTSSSFDYCIGSTAVTGRCPSALDPVVAQQMKLPLPRRVRAAAGGHADSIAKSIYDYEQTVVLKIKGPSAVVPMWYGLQSSCARNAKSIIASASSQLASMEITLPAGVTCTSRSGKAFDSKCPAASSGS